MLCYQEDGSLGDSHLYRSAKYDFDFPLLSLFRVGFLTSTKDNFRYAFLAGQSGFVHIVPID